MKTHTFLGAKAIDALIKRLPEVSFLHMAKDIAEFHHEWWNGEGYPHGKSRYDIPLPARILSLADFYDALSFPRVYRLEVLKHDEILKLIEGRRGTHFDPIIVANFFKIHSEFEKIRNKYSEEGIIGERPQIKQIIISDN